MKFTQEQQENGYTLMPKGEYKMMLVGVKSRISANEDEYYSFDFQVIDGQFKDRHIFENIAIESSSEKWNEISIKKVKNLAYAIDKELTDENDFFDAKNVPFTAYVGISKDEKNQIYGFSRLKETLPKQMDTPDFKDDIPEFLSEKKQGGWD
jgi:lipopolysaccharide export LptBFGC system permease protein LptF